jgi:ribosomal protein L37AE/L43A
VFGFTGAKVYDSDVTRPTGAIKVAWEQARKRTQLHCTECAEGRLEQATSGYVCNACGWQTTELPPGLTAVRIHDLRHTAVSRMFAAKIPMPMIARIVGWSAGTMAKMAARYGQLSLDEMREAMSAVGRPQDEISSGYPKKSPKSGDSEAGAIQ